MVGIAPFNLHLPGLDCGSPWLAVCISSRHLPTNEQNVPSWHPACVILKFALFSGLFPDPLLKV